MYAVCLQNLIETVKLITNFKDLSGPSIAGSNPAVCIIAYRQWIGILILCKRHSTLMQLLRRNKACLIKAICQRPCPKTDTVVQM